MKVLSPAQASSCVYGHHRQHSPARLRGRKVAGPDRLAPVRVGAAVAEEGQVAVREAARQANLLRQQVTEVGPLQFAEGQVGQYSGQQEHGTPPGMAWSSTNTIAGAVLPLPGPGTSLSQKLFTPLGP